MPICCSNLLSLRFCDCFSLKFIHFLWASSCPPLVFHCPLCHACVRLLVASCAFHPAWDCIFRYPWQCPCKTKCNTFLSSRCSPFWPTLLLLVGAWGWVGAIVSGHAVHVQPCYFSQTRIQHWRSIAAPLCLFSRPRRMLSWQIFIFLLFPLKLFVCLHGFFHVQLWVVTLVLHRVASWKEFRATGTPLNPSQQNNGLVVLFHQSNGLSWEQIWNPQKMFEMQCCHHDTVCIISSCFWRVASICWCCCNWTYTSTLSMHGVFTEKGG